MKHILPLLTLALLGAAATAFADPFYYDYYRNPGISKLDKNTVTFAADKPADTSYFDTVSYKNFEATRFSDWGSDLLGENSNFYYIHPLGKDVDLFLTDRVNSIYKDYSDALFKNISEYGYRKLTFVDGKYVATGETVIYKVSTDANGNPLIEDPDGIITSAQAIDTIPIYGGSDSMNRYQYQLGTFSSDDVIELYMKDIDGGVAYSYSDYYAITQNGDTYEHVGSLGAFGDGDQVNLSTDMILDQYYFQDANLAAAGYTVQFGNDEEARGAASAKAMPLSALDPSGSRVLFGIIGSVDGVIGGYKENPNGGNGNGVSGSPLPGGLQFALIAGLFGLGFWYIRRRKAVAA